MGAVPSRVNPAGTCRSLPRFSPQKKFQLETHLFLQASEGDSGDNRYLRHCFVFNPRKRLGTRFRRKQIFSGDAYDRRSIR
jgi:hypothetical protein